MFSAGAVISRGCFPPKELETMDSMTYQEVLKENLTTSVRRLSLCYGSLSITGKDSILLKTQDCMLAQSTK